jgi:hypothetical protein
MTKARYSSLSKSPPNDAGPGDVCGIQKLFATSSLLRSSASTKKRSLVFVAVAGILTLWINVNFMVSTFDFKSTSPYWSGLDMDSMNFTTAVALLEKAQLPPPNAPWVQVFDNSTGKARFTRKDLNNHLLTRLETRIDEELNTTGTIKHDNGDRLYMIHSGTLWALKDQQQILQKSHWYGGRFQPFEEMVQFGLQLGRNLVQLDDAMKMSNNNGNVTINLPSTTITTKKLPMDRIRELLGRGSGDQKGTLAIPLIVDPLDFAGCPAHVQFPKFTYAMASPPTVETCVPFAVPCYEMWEKLQWKHRFEPSDWNSTDMERNYRFGLQNLFQDTNWPAKSMNEYDKLYPWKQKIQKVVWRGSTTGGNPGLSGVSDWRKLPRFQLVGIGREHSDTMDFGFTELLQGWEQKPYSSEILQELGPTKKKIKPQIFMKYKAVLDINGNSWSSRFGHLMCLNSVVVMVRAAIRCRSVFDCPACASPLAQYTSTFFRSTGGKDPSELL